MARQAKPISGVVESVGKIRPYKNRYRFYFKESGQIRERALKDKIELERTRQLLIRKMAAESAGLSNQVTWLSAEQIKQAEIVFQKLANKGWLDLNDSRTASQLVEAVDWFLDNYREVENKPFIIDCYEFFIRKQEESGLSPQTLRDYKRFVRRFAEKYKDRRVDEINGQENRSWINSYKSNAARFNCYGYLYAFWNFCCGKDNAYAEEPWLVRNPINFKKPHRTTNDIESYTFSEIKKLIKRANEIGLLGYVIFRLFSMIRYDEHLRFVKLAGTEIKDNRFINFENKTIHLNSRVYLKRNQTEHRGRHLKIHPVFRAWLDYFIKNGIGIGYVRTLDENVRRVIIKSGTNHYRHTAITMHYKRFQRIDETATQAGTSDGIIRKDYLNVNIQRADAIDFYRLTPEKAIALNLI